MKKMFYCVIMVVLSSCTHSFNKDESVIDFEVHTPFYFSSLLQESPEFIELKCEDELLGGVTQIKVYNEEIYILDAYGTKTLYVFDPEGNYKKSLTWGVGGPGEFVFPVSFVIDEKEEQLIIRDFSLHKLFFYEIGSLSFLKTMDIPNVFSFDVLDNGEFVFYRFSNPQENFQQGQLLVCSPEGELLNSMVERKKRYNFLHLKEHSFYTIEDDHCTYLPFSYDILSFEQEKVWLRYQLNFGKYAIRDDFNFDRETPQVMEQIMNMPVVRLIYPIETTDHLLVTYYIQRQKYIGVFNKKNRVILNAAVDQIADDLGTGVPVFPSPIGNDRDKFISLIQPEELEEGTTFFPLKEFIAQMENKNNPILMLYRLP